MNYSEYLNIFNKTHTFNELVSHYSKNLDFSDQACQEALQKWLLNWSNTNFKILQQLFQHRVGPKEDLIIIDDILKDADFARTYLETFGTSFLKHYCGYDNALSAVHQYVDGYSTVGYNTQYDSSGNKVWFYNGAEYPAKDMNKILIEDLKIDQAFEALLTLFWAQTPIKKLIISAYIQKMLN